MDADNAGFVGVVLDDLLPIMIVRPPWEGIKLFLKLVGIPAD